MADLAIAVTRAGGLGQIGADADMAELGLQLQKVDAELERHNGLLPIGVGLLPFVLQKFQKENEALAVLGRYQPAVVWLFAAEQVDQYIRLAATLRDVIPGVQIWIQAGNVATILDIAHRLKPDVICVQGSDAGGHGYERGASIVPLLPEAADSLAAAGHAHIPLVAAGGVADSRGAAAAFALGASGVVLGTRFLSAPETKIHPLYQQAVLAASDGAQSTKRAKVFDELRGPNIWPREYDGRSLRIQSLQDHENGIAIDDIRARHAEAIKTDAQGFAKDGSGRAAAWAGTGVGLVKKSQPAAEIVREVREGIKTVLSGTMTRL